MPLFKVNEKTEAVALWKIPAFLDWTIGSVLRQHNELVQEGDGEWD